MNENKINNLTGNQIRQSFLDFFTQKANHTFVRSSSLVPGGDSTLLFTNAGMVQFKDYFLGIEKPAHPRVVNSQKCLRVAGKHNDLEDVGQDDTHHTFFEMLGNWSFGDYYKKEAITWAWELLTEVWEIPKEYLYATVFKDEFSVIPTDEEAAQHWHQRPGFGSDHLFYLGRKDNFWEMADTGPCGPCSEIHMDLRPSEGPVTSDLLDTDRFVELWNLVFIQYNRLDENHLEPLPAVHVDTGMGFDRIVSVLQATGSNYRTDLLWPLIEKTAMIAGHSEQEIENYFTPYRVIADHARAATFLISDGVVPGNMGRNYITRMIIRRAYRFGGQIGLDTPFLAKISETVIQNYSDAYPELLKYQKTIIDTITREEEQFQRTLDKAIHHLKDLLRHLKENNLKSLTGEQAAYLYTTYGMPLEITRDIAKETGYKVDEEGFHQAMETHRLASGAGKAIGAIGGEDVSVYRSILENLRKTGKLGVEGVSHQPYGNPGSLTHQTEILALVKNKKSVSSASPNDKVDVILPVSIFYLESGGQVSDKGVITGEDWEIEVIDIRKPAAGIITHVGQVIAGHPKVGDKCVSQVNEQRRQDIMRNHTATHLLHAALQEILGSHARQAGSLVAPNRLRFDYTHPEAPSQEEIWQIEDYVNQKILRNFPLETSYKNLDEAIEGGAIALFGEKYEGEVRNVIIGDRTEISNELCGGTHVGRTSEIGVFKIINEGSVAAGIRRIEALTGKQAYLHVKSGLRTLRRLSQVLGTSTEQVLGKTEDLLLNLKALNTEVSALRHNLASLKFSKVLDRTKKIQEINVLAVELIDANMDTLRQMADQYRQRYPELGISVLASVINDKPIIVASVTQDLVSRGFKAGDLAGYVAHQLGGGGGGKATIAQAGGKYPDRLEEALQSVSKWVERVLQ